MTTGQWPLGWGTGDVMTAAQYGKGIGCIADTTLGGSAATVDFSSIVGTYAHLCVVVYARGDNAAGNIALLMRLNGDSGANYDYQNILGFATTVQAAEAFAQTSALLGLIPANTAGANLFNAQLIFIPHYAGTANSKMLVTVSSMKQGTSSGNMNVSLYGAAWRSSAAINRLTLLPGAGNFVAGTRVSLLALGA